MILALEMLPFRSFLLPRSISTALFCERYVDPPLAFSTSLDGPTAFPTRVWQRQDGGDVLYLDRSVLKKSNSIEVI